MKPSLEHLTDELKKRNIRPSHQRIKVLEYLMNNRIHPTVEQVFSDLHKEIPTLSKSTVYNTLISMVAAHMVRPIDIEGNEARYDINTKNHGHFKCESCGIIYDFTINIDDFTPSELDGFEIHDKNVYFKGICQNCLNRPSRAGT